MKIFRPITFAVLLAVAGCTNTPIVNGQSVAQTNPAVSINAEKALTVAHQAYNALGTQLIANAHSGLIHGAAAATAKKLYDTAGDAILAADQADKAANETNLMAALSDANSAIAQAKTLLGVN